MWPVEANLVFVLLPEMLHRSLQEAGAHYYAFHSDSLPGGRQIPAGQVLARLVTSFATTDADIAAFAAEAKQALKTNAIAPKLRRNPTLG